MPFDDDFKEKVYHLLRNEEDQDKEKMIEDLKQAKLQAYDDVWDDYKYSNGITAGSRTTTRLCHSADVRQNAGCHGSATAALVFQRQADLACVLCTATRGRQAADHKLHTRVQQPGRQDGQTASRCCGHT